MTMSEKTRAERELERLEQCCMKHNNGTRPYWGEWIRAGLSDYFATLPPRPVKSPGQVMHDAYWKALATPQSPPKFTDYAESSKQPWEDAATALGILPQEQ